MELRAGAWTQLNNFRQGSVRVRDLAASWNQQFHAQTSTAIKRAGGWIDIDITAGFEAAAPLS